MPWPAGWGEPAGRLPVGRPIRPRFAGLAGGAPDVAVGVLLAALWVGLWTVFTLGVLTAFEDVSTLAPPDSAAVASLAERAGRAEPAAAPGGAQQRPAASPRVRR